MIIPVSILLFTSLLATGYSLPDAHAVADDLVDFNGDGYGDLAIGVPGQDGGTILGSGAVNVIYGSSQGLRATALVAGDGRADQIWTQDSINIEDEPEDGDGFGVALAAGDFNGDGRTDLAVGAPGEGTDTLSESGAVNVIYGSSQGLKANAVAAGNGRADQIWTQDISGIEDTSESNDGFGSSLVSGDFNGDGRDDLAIGVRESIGPSQDAGAVNVIYGSSNGLRATGDQIWSQFSTGVEEDVTSGELFGSSLAAGDFDGDGRDDLAIGVPKENPGITGNTNFAGGVNVIYGSPTGLSTSEKVGEFWSQDIINVEDIAEGGDNMGSSLSAGDFNGDGRDDLAIGVKFESSNAPIVANGAVNVIYGSSQGLTAVPIASGDGKSDQLWTQDSEGVEDTNEFSDEFGYSLSAGDFNNDGRDDLAIGVRTEWIGTVQRSGAVNVIYGSSFGLSASAVTTGDGRADQFWHQDSLNVEDQAETNDLFGVAVAAGDFNGDGRDDLAIGVLGETIGSVSGAGAVNVIYGVAGITFIQSGLGATVPIGGSGRTDQIWHQNSPGIEGISEASDNFGFSLAR